MGKEWLPVALPYQGTVVCVLGLDQRIQVLSGGENLSGRLRAIELTGVALDGRQLALELRAYIHHKSRLDRVFAIGESIEQLVRTMRGSRCSISLQPGQIAGVASQLRGNAVIGMSSHREGENDDAWRKVADVLDHHPPGFLRVLQVCIRQSSIPPLRSTENLGRPLGLFRSERCATPGPAL